MKRIFSLMIVIVLVGLASGIKAHSEQRRDIDES